MKTVEIKIGIQQHELTTGQCHVLEARMIAEGATRACVRDSVLHIYYTTTGVETPLRVIENSYRVKTMRICEELKHEKTTQHS